MCVPQLHLWSWAPIPGQPEAGERVSAPSSPEQSLTMTARAGDPSICFVQKGLGNQNANSFPPHQGHLPPTDHTSEVLTLPLAPFLHPCAKAWGVGAPHVHGWGAGQHILSDAGKCPFLECMAFL